MYYTLARAKLLRLCPEQFIISNIWGMIHRGKQAGKHHLTTCWGESPFAKYGNEELVGRFFETEGDPAIGEELGARLFTHAGLAGNPRTIPLIGREGAQVGEDGRPLMLADYVNFAARHHFEALEDILAFLTMQPGTRDYENLRSIMLARLNPGRG